MSKKHIFVSAILLTSVMWAQSPAPQKAPGGDAQPPQETKISPKEAEELFRDVAQILQFASKDTGLPIKKAVKPQLTSRDEVVAYLEKSMAEDKDAQRLRRSELVLKKFGLLPRDFDLQKFLVALLREQVAGYYDPKTAKVNLLDWIDLEQQRPVLAHELTHALQDQSIGLERWMKAGDVDLEDKKEPTAEDIANDEISGVRQSIVEGQAMVVLVDYMLAPTGQSLLASPQIAEAMKQGMLVGSDDSPQFQSAPIFLKEELTFPYRYGLDFEAALLRIGGKDKAFAGVLSNPPHSTRQIMEPQTYLSGEQLEAMPLPDFKRDFKNYDRFDVGAMGEFDVAILVDQYAGTDASHNLYPHWRGGYYYAARPKGDPSGPLAILYVSRWATQENAAEFAAVYAGALTKRYKHATENVENGKAPLPLHLETLSGTHTWLTEEGPLVIAVAGTTVLITESVDQATTEALEKELLAPVPSAKN